MRLFSEIALMTWFVKSTFYIPSTRQSCEYSAIWKSKNFNPFSEAFGYAINTKKPSFFLVSILLFLCYPPAIVFVISFVIIYSIYRKIIFRMSHIIDKIFQNVPFFAYRYAATTISFIRRMFFIFASAYHRPPCFSCLSSAKSMFITPMIFWIAFHTSAVSGGATDKICIIYRFYISAITFAKKFEWLVILRKLTNGNNKQHPLFSSYVF